MKARLFLFTVLFTGLAVSVLAQDQPKTKKAGKTKPAPAADAPLPEGVKEFTYKRTPQGEVTTLAVSGHAVVASPQGGAYYGWNDGVYRVDSTNRVTRIAGGSTAVGALTGDGGSAGTKSGPAAAHAGTVSENCAIAAST